MITEPISFSLNRNLSYNYVYITEEKFKINALSEILRKCKSSIKKYYLIVS